MSGVNPAFTARNLRYWTAHVSMSALPSFIFAFTEKWHTAPGVCGMLAGIAAFIAVYACLWNKCGFGRGKPEQWERALRWGARLRSAMGLIGCIGVLSPGRFLFITFIPDFWAGAQAVDLVESIGKAEPLRSIRIAIAGSDAGQRAHNVLVGDINSLIPTFFITVTEGLLLSVMLFVFSMLIWLFTPSNFAQTEK